MAEENNNSQQQEPNANEPTQQPASDPTQEPHGDGDGIDWKAEARKWEKRAKANEKQAQGKQSAEEELASIREELASIRSERDREKWLGEVSSETGVDASIIRGSTKEEMMAHAEAIAAAYKKPSAPGRQSDTRKGGGSGPKLTKQDILAIKNSKERKAAIAANIDLFK